MPTTAKKVSAIQVRQNLGTIMNEVAIRGDSYVIERAGKPMAVLVPLKEYAKLEQSRDQFFAMIEDVRKRMKGVPSEKIDAAIRDASNMT